MGPEKDGGGVRPAPLIVFPAVLLPVPILPDLAQILVPGENLFISRFILDLPPLPLMPLRAFCMA